MAIAGCTQNLIEIKFYYYDHNQMWNAVKEKVILWYCGRNYELAYGSVYNFNYTNELTENVHLNERLFLASNGAVFLQTLF